MSPVDRRGFGRSALALGLAGCASGPPGLPPVAESAPGPAGGARAAGAARPVSSSAEPVSAAAGVPRSAPPAPHEEVVAGTGLGLVVAPRGDLPLVGVALLARCGHAADPPGQAGCAALLGEMLVRGAVRQGQAVDAAGMRRQAEALGGSVEVAVSDALLSLRMTVTTPRLPEALALLADTLRQPLLSAREWPVVRDQARDGLGLRLRDPALLASLVARRTAWGRSVHGTVITPESLARLHRDDLVAMHRRWVRPDRAAVVLAGDIDPAQARALMPAVLGGWRGRGAAPELPAGPADPVAGATWLVDMPGAAQACVIVAVPWRAGSAAELDAGRLAAAVLGGGHSARLSQALRIRRGLTYGASARLELQRAGALLVAQARTEPRHAAEVASIMREEVLGLATRPAGEAELAARRAAMLGVHARQLDTVEGLGAALAQAWALGDPAASVASLAERLGAIGPDAVRAFAGRHWPAARLRTVAAGRLGGALAAFRALDPEAILHDAASLALDSPSLRR